MDALQTYQFYSKFSRWISSEGRRETWKECVTERVIPWLRKLAYSKRAHVPEEKWSWLEKMCLEQKATPALRVIQMAGKALDRCHVGVYNCAYLPINDIRSFSETLYILMQGTGVGFSVESKYVENLPRVGFFGKRPRDTIIVEDTTEGWCIALDSLIKRLFDGHDAWLDVSRVRPKGSPLETKGGYASGPEPLIELAQFLRRVFKSNAGRKLRDSDVHRIVTFIGKIVLVGGVRRAALLSLSDWNSEEMRKLKRGEFWNDKTYWDNGYYLTTANNSAVVEGNIESQDFDGEWNALATSGTGERGIFSRRAAIAKKPERRRESEFGTNPCGEIVLRPYEFCNLSIAIARENDTEETLKEKIEAATWFGMLQSLATDFGYLREDWKKNCIDERLLGVDVTGHVDCPLLRNGNCNRSNLLKRLKATAVRLSEEIANSWGISTPKAVTTVKPSGDSSVLFGCSSGIHPRYAKYYVRWVRESVDSPIARFLASQGVPYAKAPEAPDRLLVFGFPVRSPKGVQTRNDMNAKEQLENWLDWKQNYAEHSVSATIYVGENEWNTVGKWVYEHLEEITGLSFLPKDNGVYRYAPHEEISEKEYWELSGKFPKIDWGELTKYDREHYFDLGHFVCTAGSCSF